METRPKSYVFRDIFLVSVLVTVLQVLPLAVSENMSYADSNIMFPVAMAIYLYVLARQCSLLQSFKSLFNFLYV